MTHVYTPAQQPTIYFIGVTTSHSSIMKVFPEWARALGLEDAVIKGIDFRPHSSAEEYREAVEFIKNDPMSCGALVTTHKLDLYRTCEDLFDYIDPFAAQLGEVSSISKKDGLLRAHAKDPISSGLALERFVPKHYWKDYGGDVLLLGAGGSSLAMTVYLTQEKLADNIPEHIIIANRSQARLDDAAVKLADASERTRLEFLLSPAPEDNDRILASLKPHSLIVNATGLGKDVPGSPLTDACSFPEESLVWEINYRGDLLFKQQAEAQAVRKRLHVEDGWTYFIHGWTQVIAEVFHVPIGREKLDELSEIARTYSSRKTVA